MWDMFWNLDDKLDLIQQQDWIPHRTESFFDQRFIPNNIILVLFKHLFSIIFAWF